jgi:hypothetical protein
MGSSPASSSCASRLLTSATRACPAAATRSSSARLSSMKLPDGTSRAGAHWRPSAATGVKTARTRSTTRIARGDRTSLASNGSSRSRVGRPRRAGHRRQWKSVRFKVSPARACCVEF